MKYCKDCEYIGRDITLPWNLQKCKVPIPRKLDMTGSKPDFPFANISRQYGPCFSDARLFKQHVPIWKKLLTWLVK